MYRRAGTLYFEQDDAKVFKAVTELNQQGRTTNNSQVANRSGLSRAKVAKVTHELKMRGYLRDVSKGAAYHWRVASPAAPVE